MSNEALRKKAKRSTGQPLNCFRCNRKFQAHVKDCVETRIAGGALKPQPPRNEAIVAFLEKRRNRRKGEP